jgi:starch synthase
MTPSFEKETFELTGLPWEIFSPSGIEYWGKLNFMKGGIYYSEVISTVSKKYSEEVQTPEFGYGLDGVLRDRTQDVHGVVNGVDYRQWSPETDSHIPARYGPGDLSGKRACKEALLDDLGMDRRLVNAPLLGAISRLADQKGFDLLAEVMDDLMALDVGFVLLGTGEQKYHTLFEGIAKKHPGKTGIRITYDNALAHRIEAACDIFLMPSRYEPCGLNQIYSLKYGTIPVVRATGGLDDTIEDYDAAPDGGTGFKFYPYSGEEFLRAIKRALKVFQDDKAWTQLILRCMAKDFSWEQSARQYVNLYEKALDKKGLTETL